VQIEQVLLNLCINARDAAGETGRIRVTVREWRTETCLCASCRAPVAGRHVEMAVADNGPGIAPGMLERVFEPFYSTKEVGKGTGMGLAVVHGIVHEHGGHVCVDTSPDTGTVFRVLLPLADGDGAQSVAGGGRVRSARPPLLRGRVLLVDDEHAVLAFMRELLEGWGLDVTPCTSATEALEALEYGGDDVALVITDHTMPRMTGLQLAGEIGRAYPGLAVVLYTGYAEGLPEGGVEASGVRAVVRKPIEPAELRNAIVPLLGGGRRGASPEPRG
jgi:CheY-like chemotaxis protein